MMDRPFILFIEDIRISLEKIRRDTNGMDYQTFIRDELVMDGVVRNLEIIGEASKTIPKEIRDKYPDIPWRSMIALRNVAAHDYFHLELKIIWDILTIDLPETAPKIEMMLNKEK